MSKTMKKSLKFIHAVKRYWPKTFSSVPQEDPKSVAWDLESVASNLRSLALDFRSVARFTFTKLILCT